MSLNSAPAFDDPEIYVVEDPPRVSQSKGISFPGQNWPVPRGQPVYVEIPLSAYQLLVQRQEDMVTAAHDFRRLNSNLQASNKELEMFSSMVAHDLQSPLISMHCGSMLLLDKFGGDLPPEAQHLLRAVDAGAMRMQQLIAALFRLSDNRQEVLKETLDLRPLVQEIVDDLQAQARGHEVKVTIGELPECEADRPLIRQVLINLLSNAFKFTSKTDGATIEIGCKVEGDRNVYFVKDNGAGFDMKQARRLFGLFQRLHSTTEFEGNGVGLSIVHRIIRRHGGRVWAEAEAGKGATFYFTLPRAGFGAFHASVTGEQESNADQLQLFKCE
jgi:light-regulated signal transduction histidine kinase (bacteriophytochrome)